jgi:hypothetical protein
MDRILNPMEVDYHAREFIASRRLSASPTRCGDTGLAMAALARGASALERAAARVEGWARGAAEPTGRPSQARAR